MQSDQDLRISHVGWNFDNSYSRLPESLFERVGPEPVSAPRLVVLNESLADELGLSPEALRQTPQVFAGNEIPPGAEPIAQAYAGHQFGYFTMLGDGRAVLLGEHVKDGQRVDIQLKGSGRTSFSRRGDGRASLGPMLREYIIGEAMHALSIPTTRALAVAETGDPVYRQCKEKGAVLTRVASSHIRVGTFQFLAASEDYPTLEKLLHYTLERHYAELVGAPNPALALLSGVVDRQASLIAKWLGVGFVHGVMNTDNMALSGETIDYGPCAFIDVYSPQAVFSSIDTQGRYALGNQPKIAQWNLARLAETLLPFVSEREEEGVEMATDAVKAFADRFQFYWSRVFNDKLGLIESRPEDSELCNSFLSLLDRQKADYTRSFRSLLQEEPSDPVFQVEEGRAWHERWRMRTGGSDRSEVEELLRRNNPVLIPRNHLVEEALLAATRDGNLGLVEELVTVLKTPYSELPSDSPYLKPVPETGGTYKTFCGT